MIAQIGSYPTAKQRRSGIVGPSAWYPYYAGYSDAFVGRILDSFGARSGSIVLDPWNGAGTTTQVAFERGCLAVGVDINPAMLYIAYARCCPATSARVLMQQATAWTRRTAESIDLPSDDPLIPWIGDSAAQAVRLLLRKANGCEAGTGALVRRSIAGLMPEQAFHFVAVFRTLASILASTRTSNPTWVRQLPTTALPPIDAQTIYSVYRAIVSTMVDAGFAAPVNFGTPLPSLLTGSARHLPIASNSVDFVVTSPPYCTRIDYIVSTRLELAALGLTNDHTRRLRDQTSGTSTVRSTLPDVLQEWGPSCTHALRSIQTHPSKASLSYYYKTFIQYFDDLYHSFLELARCCRRGAKIAIVVQDSYYKDLHVDLPTIVAEMGMGLGWRLAFRSDDSINRTLAHVNTKARKYTRLRRAVEATLLFTVE